MPKYMLFLLVAAALLVAGCANTPTESNEDRFAREHAEKMDEFARVLPEDANLERLEHQAVLVRHGVYLSTSGETVPLPERSFAQEKIECVACASLAPEPSDHVPSAMRLYEPIRLKVK